MAELSIKWTVHTQAEQQAVGLDPEALSIELDPRARVVRLGLYPLGATSQEADSGTILLRHLSAERADWAPVRAWLLGPEGTVCLSAIAAGHRAEQLWSGDWQAQWTEQAWEAASQVHHAIEGLLS